VTDDLLTGGLGNTGLQGASPTFADPNNPTAAELRKVAIYNNLKNGTPLPPSQLVRTVPRGGTPGAAPPITAANVPPISASPAATDLITFSNNTVTIPN
jgi:3HB-oligomer hydrolase (3HBOH)